MFPFNVRGWFSVAAPILLSSVGSFTHTFGANDMVIVNSTDFNAFVHVQSHYFFGRLDIQTPQTKTRLHPGARFLLSGVPFSIRHSGVASGRASVFLVPKEECNDGAVHASHFRTLSGTFQDVRGSQCVVMGTGRSYVTVDHQDGQIEFIPPLVDTNTTGGYTNGPTVAVLKDISGTAHLEVDTLGITGDWIDKPSKFKRCDSNMVCEDMPSLSVETQGADVRLIASIVIIFCMPAVVVFIKMLHSAIC